MSCSWGGPGAWERSTHQAGQRSASSWSTSRCMLHKATALVAASTMLRTQNTAHPLADLAQVQLSSRPPSMHPRITKPTHQHALRGCRSASPLPAAPPASRPCSGSCPAEHEQQVNSYSNKHPARHEQQVNPYPNKHPARHEQQVNPYSNKHPARHEQQVNPYSNKHPARHEQQVNPYPNKHPARHEQQVNPFSNKHPARHEQQVNPFSNKHPARHAAAGVGSLELICSKTCSSRCVLASAHMQ